MFGTFSTGLRQTPKLHAITFRNVRKAVVAKFPFIVIYREELDVVLIEVLTVCRTVRVLKMGIGNGVPK